jgi:hypothetical protein
LDRICGDSVRAEREEVGQQANGFAMAPRCGLLQQVQACSVILRDTFARDENESEIELALGVTASRSALVPTNGVALTLDLGPISVIARRIPGPYVVASPRVAEQAAQLFTQEIELASAHRFWPESRERRSR